MPFKLFDNLQEVYLVLMSEVPLWPIKLQLRKGMFEMDVFGTPQKPYKGQLSHGL